MEALGDCYSHAILGLRICQMFAPLLKSHSQWIHLLFLRHHALLSSDSLPFIPTLNHSASCSGPYSDLMVLIPYILSLVCLAFSLHPTSSFTSPILITYLPCFICMFDTYTYAPCTYYSSVCSYMLTCLAC